MALARLCLKQLRKGVISHHNSSSAAAYLAPSWSFYGRSSITDSAISSSGKREFSDTTEAAHAPEPADKEKEVAVSEGGKKPKMLSRRGNRRRRSRGRDFLPALPGTLSHPPALSLFFSQYLIAACVLLDALSAFIILMHN